jgi:NAD(P)H-flavin reductase
MAETHLCTSNRGLRNPYLPMRMVIQRIADETDDRTIKSFDLAFDDPADGMSFHHRPGQFCELSLFGVGEAPFGIASAPSETGFVRFTVKQAGLLTTELHTLSAGDLIGMRGPLGNAFPLDLMRGRDAVIIGGGFAFTTLRALIVHLLQEREAYGRITVIYGARTPGLLMYQDDLAAWEARDDIALWQTIDAPAEGWTRKVGFVPAVVEAVAPDATDAVAVICGPPVMIRFTLPVLIKLGFARERVYTSLENRMKCGIGKCGRCNVGPKYVCVDGPVFSLADLDELPGEY